MLSARRALNKGVRPTAGRGLPKVVQRTSMAATSQLTVIVKGDPSTTPMKLGDCEWIQCQICRWACFCVWQAVRAMVYMPVLNLCKLCQSHTYHKVTVHRPLLPSRAAHARGKEGKLLGASSGLYAWPSAFGAWQRNADKEGCHAAAGALQY
jgi:hypothetical protein